jgi:hypothetical protein
MKTKKLPKKPKGDFDAFEKPKKSGAVVKNKRSKKPSIYDEIDELDELNEFMQSDRDYVGFDDFYSDDDENLD